MKHFTVFRRSKVKCLRLRGRWRANVACLLLSGAVLCFLTIARHPWNSMVESRERLTLKSLNWTELVYLHKTNCRFHTCFDVNRCVFSMEDTIGVYIGGWYEFHGPQTPSAVSPTVSLEYAELVAAVEGSRYHVSDPVHACVFIPPLDTLSQDQMEVVGMSTFLNSLPQ